MPQPEPAGRHARGRALRGRTDSRVFRRVGIPVAVFGPTPYGMGAADEHVTVAGFLDTVRGHALTALEILKGDR